MIIVETFVAGAPKTKGSMEVRNRATGAMKESVIGSSNWRALMAAAIKDDIERRGILSQGRAALGPLPWSAPVAVTVVAYLPPPADPGPDAAAIRRTWYRDAMAALRTFWPWPVWDQAGDLDKLVRNVLDALGSKSRNSKMNGGAIVDDNLVCRINAEKHVGGGTRPQGVLIRMETL